MKDPEIARAIRDAYLWSPLVDLSQINVGVEHGRAVLRGNVSSDFDRWNADDIAARTRGVTAIDNRLTVRGG